MEEVSVEEPSHLFPRKAVFGNVINDLWWPEVVVELLVKEAQKDIADVCLILEGCYPYTFGGVSSWTHTLMQALHETTFHVVSIQPDGIDLVSKYERLPNIVGQTTLVLRRERSLPGRLFEGDKDPSEVLKRSFFDASEEAFAALVSRMPPLGQAGQARDADVWAVTREMYSQLAPSTSFAQFFWVWHTLLNSLTQVIRAEPPPARVYHAISTGYAGLFGTAAKLRTGRPLLLTEHGIYTNERTVELMAAATLHDSFETDAYLSDERRDARDVWIRAFECMGLLCYRHCDRITSLSQSGQAAQHGLGAPPTSTEIIPNGVELERFSTIKLKPPGGQQVVAFIGRVVAIKDVMTFVRAMDIVFQSYPDAKAWIVGPEGEEPEYAACCRKLVDSLGIGERLSFLGMRNVVEILSQVDMVVLTSLSEAQPFALLEAGAAGLPCVSTDVGSCRDIIEGTDATGSQLGGYVTDLMSPEDTAQAIMKLLADPAEARALGTALKARILDHYGLDKMRDSYLGLYRSHLGPSAAPKAIGG